MIPTVLSQYSSSFFQKSRPRSKLSIQSSTNAPPFYYIFCKDVGIYLEVLHPTQVSSISQPSNHHYLPQNLFPFFSLINSPTLTSIFLCFKSHPLVYCLKVQNSTPCLSAPLFSFTTCNFIVSLHITIFFFF